MIDRLGADCILVQDGPEHFTVTADVVVSPQFFAWVSGFGSQARIVSPAAVVEQMRAHAEAVAGMYRA